MKTKILTLLVLIAIAVASCQKDEADKPVAKQDVSFGIELIEPGGLKTDPICPTDLEGNLLVPTIAEIVIGGETYWPQIFWLNGGLYTQAIKLDVAPGVTQDYVVTKFVLWTQQPDPELENDPATIVMAIPQTDAVFAKYVSKKVPFTITVAAFEKNEVPVDVLCFIPEKVDEFGFFWFVIDEIIIREQCFFGDLCIKDKADYLGSLYETVFGTGLTNYPFDLPAIFKVVVTRTNVDAPWTKTFINVDGNNYIAPLCIKYPDRLGIDDNYKIELLVLVAQGDGWDYVKFYEWEFMDNIANLEEVDPDQVIDFVIGNCNYNPTGLVLPAWLNLPDRAQINAQQDWDYLYWKLNVLQNDPAATGYDVLNVGLWASFCGDGRVGLSAGTHWFNIYNVLSFDKWNIMPTIPLDGYEITAEKFNQIHWLINNLGTFDGFPTLTGIYLTKDDLDVNQAKTLQDVIWLIINEGLTPLNGWATGGSDPTTLSEGMATAASSTQAKEFKPLPGQWSSVLIIKDDLPKTYQLIFLVVDP